MSDNFIVNIPCDLRDRLMLIASAQHCSIDDLMIDLLSTYVNLYDYSQYYEVLR